LIVEKDNRYFKLQIKTVLGRKIPMRKISHNMGKYKVTLYTDKDIDYFVGVDLINNDLYILPISFSSQYKSSISINMCQLYKNNFKQLERTNGNISNEHDDNAESLTDNADGNGVGMKEISAARE
jgi:hypothetical protein